MLNNERANPYLISQRNGQFQETYSEDAYLDEPALDREMEIIKTNRIRTSEGESKIHFETRDQARTWNNLTGRLIDIEHGFDISIEGTTVHDAYARFASIGGLALLHGDVWERILSFAHKRGSGMDDSLGEYAKWSRLAIEAQAMVRIAGLSLRDVEDLDLNKPGAVVQGFRFMAEAQGIRTEMGHDKWVNSPHQHPIFAPFPNKCKFALEGASGAVMAAISLNSRNLKDIISGNKGINRELYTRFGEFWSKIQVLKSRIYNTIKDPESKDFGDIKDQWTRYQESDSYRFRVIVAHLIGLSNVDNIYDLYRDASDFVKEGKEVEFYSKLMVSIREYVQAESPEEGVLTSDEVPTIFDNDVEINLDSVNAKTEDYAGLVKDTFKRSAVSEYDIDPENILVPNLVPPQSIHVSFNKSKPQEFKVQLGYENEIGEKVNIELELGTNKDGHFGWSFIETSKESKELFNLHKTFLLFVYNVLVEINKRVTEKYEQKNASKPIIPPTVKSKEKGEYVPDVWRKNDPSDFRPSTVTPIQEVLNQEVSQDVETSITAKIKTAEGEVLDNLMRNLSTVDRDLVRLDINEYNTRGIGKFYRLKSLGPDGEPLYVLRVRVVTRGDARVLLHEVESEQGTRSFEVLDIDYRKDIYRRHKI